MEIILIMTKLTKEYFEAKLDKSTAVAIQMEFIGAGLAIVILGLTIFVMAFTASFENSYLDASAGLSIAFGLLLQLCSSTITKYVVRISKNKNEL